MSALDWVGLALFFGPLLIASLAIMIAVSKN